MRVWWCEEHQAPGDDLLLPTPDPCYGIQRWASQSPQENPCRFVEMQLVPADARMVSGDALVVEKVEGEWPKWAVNAIGLVDNIHASYVLDNFALASAQVGGK